VKGKRVLPLFSSQQKSWQWNEEYYSCVHNKYEQNWLVWLNKWLKTFIDSYQKGLSPSHWTI